MENNKIKLAWVHTCYLVWFPQTTARVTGGLLQKLGGDDGDVQLVSVIFRQFQCSTEPHGTCTDNCNPLSLCFLHHMRIVSSDTSRHQR